MPKAEVDAWFAKFDHPLKEVMQDVRRRILAADRRMDECIKWQSPTFTFEGNLASFNPRAKKHVSLMFHTGAHIPGDFPHLQGGGGTAKYMTFADLAEAKARATELKAVVKAWINWKSGEKSAPQAKSKQSKRPAGAKKTAAKRPAAKRAKKKKL